LFGGVDTLLEFLVKQGFGFCAGSDGIH
jgi:hypothetical protein